MEFGGMNFGKDERTLKERAKDIAIQALYLVIMIAIPCGVIYSCEYAVKSYERYGSVDGIIDKWYEKDRAKCMEKAPVYGFTGEYRPYWDEDGHECLMLTQDSIYKRLDERSIRRRMEE